MQALIHGFQMTYTDEGQGLPVLLFIHGFPLSRGAWDKQVRAFAQSHRVIAPDLRGLGESGVPAGPVTMSRFADDLVALLRGLTIGPVVLIGHSMGGYVALNWVDRHPDLVSGLVLVGTRAGADTVEGAGKRLAAAAKVRTEGAAFVIDDMAPKMLAAGHQDPDLARQVRALMEPASPPGLANALEGMADRADVTSSLARIGVPTLVVTGTEDTLIPPSESALLASHIAGAELELIPGAGHLAAFEQPEAFNRLLQAWLVRAFRSVAP